MANYGFKLLGNKILSLVGWGAIVISTILLLVGISVTAGKGVKNDDISLLVAGAITLALGLLIVWRTKIKIKKLKGEMNEIRLIQVLYENPEGITSVELARNLRTTVSKATEQLNDLQIKGALDFKISENGTIIYDLKGIESLEAKIKSERL